MVLNCNWCNMALQIDKIITVITNKDGVFFIDSIKPGEHQIFMPESLIFQPSLMTIDVKKDKSKTIILKREEYDLPIGEDNILKEDLIAAAELWGRDRSVLYYFNSAILANMLSPESIELAYTINKASRSLEDKIFNLVAFEQQNFTHFDYLVAQDPNKSHTMNELWGSFRTIDNNLEPLYLIEIPEISRMYYNFYNTRAFACEGFALFNAAMLRLIGLSIEDVIIVNTWGEVGHVGVLVDISEGPFLFSNQYLHKKNGISVEGESSLFGYVVPENLFVFQERGLANFANDYYNVFTPETITNNMPKEKVEKWYELLSELFSQKIPVIIQEGDKFLNDYPRGQHPIISFEKFLPRYKEGKVAGYPKLKIKINEYDNWVNFYNALRQEVWENAEFFPDSPYTLAKYNSRSLLVKKPEIYAIASIKGVKLAELVSTVLKDKNTEEIMAWIKEHITGEIYTQPTQIMLADETIIFSAGRSQDKALLTFSILNKKGINSEIIIGESGSYILVEQGNKLELWNMNKMEKTNQLLEKPIMIFTNNDEQIYYPSQGRLQNPPIDFKSFLIL